MPKKTKKTPPRKASAKRPAPKPSRKTVVRKTTTRKTTKAPKRRASAVPRRASSTASKGKVAPRKPASVDPLARRMAAFSKQVIKEEDAPVAVRTFNEAREGTAKSKELDLTTGALRPVKAADEADEDLPEFEDVTDEVPPSPSTPQRGRPTGPKIEPLAGKLAVPKAAPPDDFQIAAPAPRGKKGAPPTKDDLGKIELRMQRGTTDKTIAHASPDYLQRSFKKASETGRTAATPSTAGQSKDESFEVAMDRPARRIDSSLTDFGDVEIAQQTRKGKRTVGSLDAEENEEKGS